MHHFTNMYGPALISELLQHLRDEQIASERERTEQMDLPEVFKLLLPLKPEGRSQPGRSGLHETRDGHTTGCIVVEKTVTLKSPESQPSAVYS